MTESLRWQEWKKIGRESKKDYTRHQWDRRGRIALIMESAGIVFLLSFFFYRSIWAVFPLSVIGVFYGRAKAQKKAAEDRQKLLGQFRDMIQAASSAMKAGYSVENAFIECRQDMCLMHGENSFICRELTAIQRGLAMNLTLEDLLLDLGNRSLTSQIEEFASVFSIAKRCGGNMAQVIQTSVESISRSVEIREEILTQTAARRMEQNIMNLMPFGILVYVDVSSRGYFDMLYHNLYGVVVMSGCLIVYLAAYCMAEGILHRAAAIWE